MSQHSRVVVRAPTMRPHTRTHAPTQRELESNYDANAKVIEMLLGRSKAGKKRDEMEGDKAKGDAKRRKGTLLLWRPSGAKHSISLSVAFCP